ncbi:type I-B CRISPR-associated protein Cas5b [Thermoanaerobacterium thermosaccharolyticum]|jgi:CRISPR-associated protein Cas5h|uniref:type I-B CRISPR-associated protein Cas5b n=1 Tax=Thermoanaerobacterium thermosaccharolyticum TaxID=1517 RepID=UPI0017837F20|nr:type I-B CRISPR-associated protein Cas5b [Thermoanaerobacterium thermosaccharolyticum]MBE0068293.1 type I-B CRISPR-associated protein Cas5 [Thermoanaerobacterium thermosaccharolyticum]MBE0227731.1 type I-B CRISPR-associated protein Cas5 [Thermoanaerobacterium thermosaccharolyticum]
MKSLIFDIYGDFGHFKKYYTTSSPLTFSFPPPPTIKGMLGAIGGISKTEYLKTFRSDKCKIAVRILRPVKKIRMGLNLINTKDNFWIPFKKKNHEARTQVKMELLKDPMYRIYFSHEDDELFNDIVEKVRNHHNVYTLSLGLSEMIADYRFVDVKDAFETGDVETEISSVLPYKYILDNKIVFEDGKKYFKEKIPFDMDEDRVVLDYSDVVYEANGKSIRSYVLKSWVIDDEYVMFF